MIGCDEALFPEIRVVCPACAAALLFGDGLEPYETLWMHEHECAVLGEPALWAIDAA